MVPTYDRLSLPQLCYRKLVSGFFSPQFCRCNLLFYSLWVIIKLIRGSFFLILPSEPVFTCPVLPFFQFRIHNFVFCYSWQSLEKTYKFLSLLPAMAIIYWYFQTSKIIMTCMCFFPRGLQALSFIVTPFLRIANDNFELQMSDSRVKLCF